MLADGGFKIYLQLASTFLKEADKFPYLKTSTEAAVLCFVVVVVLGGVFVCLLWASLVILFVCLFSFLANNAELQAERAGILLPRKEKAPGRLYFSLRVLKRDL